MNKYLQAVENHNLIPNFWMSEEYILKANLRWVEENGLSGYKINPKGNEWFFPPINEKDGLFDMTQKIFCGFVEPLDFSSCGSFLDFQFFYNPKDFLNIDGSRWGVFRKNIRKIPKRMHNLSYVPIGEKEFIKKITQLIVQWGERIKEVQDHIVCTQYVLRGDNRWGLFAGKKLIGLNVWDENFKFINFRYCIDNGTPFLQEYLRYRFYTNPVIVDGGKLVNDGGALDNFGLRQFKEKLNPVEIQKVCQYKGRM